MQLQCNQCPQDRAVGEACVTCKWAQGLPAFLASMSNAGAARALP